MGFKNFHLPTRGGDARCLIKTKDNINRIIIRRTPTSANMVRENSTTELANFL